MLANGITQTTNTTGTGALTLAAATGFPKFSDAFRPNERIAYSLLNAAGQFLEAGVGYLSDANTFVRARVTATFDGGAYNNVNPTAVNLAGTTTVQCSIHSATAESVIPTIDTNSAGLNRFISPANRTHYTANMTVAAMRCYYYPVLLKVGTPITSLVCSVTTASPGAVARMGLYSAKPNGYIGELLATTGDIDMGTTGLKNAPLNAPVFIAPGWYYVAFVATSNPTIVGWGSNTQYAVGGSPLGYSGGVPTEFRHETLAAAVMPAVAPDVTTGVGAGVSNIPMILFGVGA